MKFNQLSKEQQTVLTAWMNGETMQYQSIVSGDWRDVTAEEEMGHYLFDRKLRVKPKEPVVKHTYAPIRKNNGTVGPAEEDIQDICYYDKSAAVSFLQRTYHDGKFVKAEVIPKLELRLKGLI